VSHAASGWRWAARLIAVVSVGALLVNLWTSEGTSRIDFYVYAEAISASGSMSLYDFQYRILGLPFLYPPFAAIVLWPLSAMTNSTGESLWWCVTAACSVWFLAVVGWSIAPVAARRWPRSPFADPEVAVLSCVAAGVWTMPVLLNGRLGQVNALVAALIVTDLVLLRRRSALAGVGTGLAAAIKVTPALLIPYLFLAGRRRASAVAATSFVVATGIAAVVYPSDTWRFFRSELWSTRRAPDVDTFFNNTIRRVAAGLPNDRLELLVWALVSLLVLVVAFRRAVRADRAGNVLAAFTLVMLASYLVSPLTWGHHLFFLIPAVLWWLVTADAWWRWALGAVAVVALVDPMGLGETPSMSLVRIAVMAVMVFALPTELAEPQSVEAVAAAVPAP
jgi:alpha-1,2-mannosyltransferase